MAVVAFALAGCSSGSETIGASGRPAARALVAARIQSYGHAVKTVNADSVADYFAERGELIEPGTPAVRGRDSIRTFVASYKGVRIDSVLLTNDAVDVFGNRAYEWGSYFERVAMPGQPLMDERGRFVAELIRQKGQWLILRFLTQPAPPPPAK